MPKPIRQVRNIKPPSGRSKMEIVTDIAKFIEEGMTLRKALKEVKDAPSSGHFRNWVDEDKKVAEVYAHARVRGYKMLADELVDIADEAQVAAEYDGDDVTLRLDSTAVARNNLRISTRKWVLSKMLPKIYGDKIVQEMHGLGGGPIQLAALDFRGLTPEELSILQGLLAKAAPAPEPVEKPTDRGSHITRLLRDTGYIPS